MPKDTKKRRSTTAMVAGTVLVALALALFLYGLGDLAARLLPVRDVAVEIVDRDRWRGAEGWDVHKMTLRLPDGGDLRIGIEEDVFDSLPRTGLDRIVLERSVLLGRPVALRIRPPTLRERGLVRQGGALDTLLQPDAPAEEARRHLRLPLLPPWPLSATFMLAGLGVGAIAASLMRRRRRALARGA